MLLFETGLVIYHVTTGLLMGSELVNRPLWEILHTIGGVVDIWIIILSFMVMLLLTLLFVRFSRICVCSRCSWIIVTLMFVSVPMAVVSHNDIVPSLNALLRDNFSLKTPEYIHWVGSELDTFQTFSCELKTCFLRYTRTIYDGIFDKYYYTMADKSKKAYLIKENLELEEIDDEEIITDIDENFNALIYADNYAYTNNKVTKHPIFQHSVYDTVNTIVIDSVYCKSSSEKPSISKPETVDILSTTINGEYDEVKIIMTADVLYTSGVWQDQFINLGVRYSHGKNQSINSSDNISKSFVDGWYDKNRWTKMEFVKIFSLKETDNHKLEIYLKPTTKDYLWDPEHSVLLKNINIMILTNSK